MSYITDALALYQAYESQKNNGKFKTVPEDPSLTALRGKVLGYVDNSPTRDFMGSLIQQRLANANPGFQLPTSPRYNPNAGAGSAAPKYDLSKLLPSMKGTAPSTTNPNSKPPAASGPAYGEQGPSGLPDMPYGQNGTPTTVEDLWNLAKAHGPEILVGLFGGPLGTAAYELYQHLKGPSDPTMPNTHPNQFSNGNPITPADIAPGGGAAPRQNFGGNDPLQGSYNDFWAQQNNGLMNGGSSGGVGYDANNPYGSVFGPSTPRR